MLGTFTGVYKFLCPLIIYRLQRPIQHNKWLYSVKLVGYTENKRNLPCGIHRRIGEYKGVPHRSMCNYMRVYVCKKATTRMEL